MANSNSKAIILEKKWRAPEMKFSRYMYPGAESNCYLKFRKLLFYPLGKAIKPGIIRQSEVLVVKKK